MQNRKELAEAGRRKLEEFRKAKAQGRAVTAVSSNPPAPASNDPVSVPTTLANGNGGSYPEKAHAIASSPAPQTAAAAARYCAPSETASNGTMPFPHVSEQPPAVPEAAAQPIQSAIHAVVPSPASPPVTTFVVLQDAPIPFGAPAAIPANYGPRMSNNGITRVSSSGGMWPYGGGPAAAAAATGATVTTDASILAMKPLSGASGTRPDPSEGPAHSGIREPETAPCVLPSPMHFSAGFQAENDREAPADAGLGDDVIFFDSSGGKEQHGLPPWTAEPSTSTSNGLAIIAPVTVPSISPLGIPADTSRIHKSFTTGNSFDSYEVNQSPAPAFKAAPSWDPSSSGMEPVVASDSKAQLGGASLSSNVHGIEAVLSDGDNVGAERSSRVAPDSNLTHTDKIHDLPPVQPATMNASEVPHASASSEARGAVSPSALGYSGVLETRQVDVRPPWLLFSTAMAPTTAAASVASHEVASAAATASGAALSDMGVMTQSVPSSGTAKETIEVVTMSDAPLRPFGLLEGAKGEGIALVATTVKNMTCYDQLSDSYLSTNIPVEGGSGADAWAPTGPPLLPPVGTEGQLTSYEPPEHLPGAAAAAGSLAALPLLVSAGITPPFADENGTVSRETSKLALLATGEGARKQPQAEVDSMLTSSSAAGAQAPPPTRAAPPQSRFAWLFGHPPQPKQPVPLEQPVAASAPTQLPTKPSAAPQPVFHPSRPTHPYGALQSVLARDALSQALVLTAPLSKSNDQPAFQEAVPVVDDVGQVLVASHVNNLASASASSTWIAPDAAAWHSSMPSILPVSTAGPLSSSRSPEAPYHSDSSSGAVEAHRAASGLSEGSRVDVNDTAGDRVAELPRFLRRQAPEPTGISDIAGAGPLSAGLGTPNSMTVAPTVGGGMGTGGPSSGMLGVTSGDSLAPWRPYAPAFGNAMFDSSNDRSAGLMTDTSGQEGPAPTVPSFLRGIDIGARESGRDERDGLASGIPLEPGVPSGTSYQTASESATVTVPAGDFVTAPSFSTSFPPVGPAGLPPLPHAAPQPPSTAPASANAVNPVSTPHFTTAASYLSAYSSAAGTAHHGNISSFTNTTTKSSFLESYLDNLLSTMSATAKNGAEDSHSKSNPGAVKGSSAGVHHSVAAGAGPSNSVTPRHSQMGDALGEVGAAPLGWQVLGNEAQEEVPGRSSGMGDQALSTSYTAAAGETGSALEGEGGSGRGTALHRVDSAAQLRSHHSRRVSVDSAGVLSVHSHATGIAYAAGPTAHGTGGNSSGVSRAQFAALQQHIDELTEEKLALLRGLQQQTRINEQLAEENEELMRQYNSRGAATEELQRKVKQYEQELEAQTLSLEGFSEERQAARSSYVEANSRAQALAAEVVGLEAQLLQLKSAVLKAERAAEEAQQRSKKLEKQVETLTREAQERAQELQQTQLKGRNLVVKLKQTEVKLEAAENKLATQAALAGNTVLRGADLPNGHAPPPPPSPPRANAEQEVQCDLFSELLEATREAAQINAPEASGTNGTIGDAGVAPTADNGQADGASTSNGAIQDGVAGSALVLARQTSGAVSNDLSDTAARLIRVDWEAVRPSRDAPSAAVAERVLSAMDSRALRAAVRGALPEGLGAVALQLARWLPAGPVSGGDAVAVMVEEELRLMESIHELLGSFEQAQESTAAQIAELRARVATLTSENDELSHKLELQTQRLELQMQALQTQGMTAGQALSLHKTPVAGPSAVMEGTPSIASPTPSAGPHSYQPAQSFLPVPADHDAAVVTPTRSMRVTPMPSMESTVAGAPPIKQTWMGYLFRPRQKKRTRSAIL